MFVWPRLFADMAGFLRLVAGMIRDFGIRSRERARMRGERAEAALEQRRLADAIDKETRALDDAQLDAWLSQFGVDSVRVRVGPDYPGESGGSFEPVNQDQDREP